MKAKTRKIVTGVCALVLTAAVSIAGTIAYLTKTTEYRVNNFTFASTAVNAMLTEPYWDSVIDYYYEDEDGTWVIHPIYDYIDTNGGTTSDDETVYGYVEGKKGQPIKKTPKQLMKDHPDDGVGYTDKYLEDLYTELSEHWNDNDETWDDGYDPWKLYEAPNEYPEEANSVYDKRYKPKEDDNQTPKLDSDKDGAKDKLGRLSAQLMVPGRVANKNPFVTNTGTTDEWVAVKISFVYSETAGLDENLESKAGKVLSDTDYELVQKIIRIDWNENVLGVASNVNSATDLTSVTAGKWFTQDYSTTATEETSLNGADAEHPIKVKLNSGNYLFEDQQTVFYYTSILEGRPRTSLNDLDFTNPIFTTVSVDKSATTEDIKALEKIGGFAIYIEGYAIQKEAFASGLLWAQDSFGTTSDPTASFGSDSMTFNEWIDTDYEGRSDGALGDVKAPGIIPSPDGPGEKVDIVNDPPKAED